MAASRLPDMDALQDEFTKYLVMARQKQLDTKTGFMAKLAGIKQQVKDKIETVRRLETLKSDELMAVQKFMQQIQEFREKPPPPPLKRPEGLELGLIGVALFSGNEPVSRVIRRITKSKYSHVALLLHDASKDPTDLDGWYVYSANGSASQIMADRRLPQVQLEKWVETIATYEGLVVTRLFVHATPDLRPNSTIVTGLVDKYIGLPYEQQLLVMLRAMNRSNVEAEDHANSAFCSEICYRILAGAKVLEDTEVPENVWPKDFGDEGHRLKLLSCNWADLVIVKGEMPEAVKSSGKHAKKQASIEKVSIEQSLESKDL